MDPALDAPRSPQYPPPQASTQSSSSSSSSSSQPTKSKSKTVLTTKNHTPLGPHLSSLPTFLRQLRLLGLPEEHLIGWTQLRIPTITSSKLHFIPPLCLSRHLSDGTMFTSWHVAFESLKGIDVSDMTALEKEKLQEFCEELIMRGVKLELIVGECQTGSKAAAIMRFTCVTFGHISSPSNKTLLLHPLTLAQRGGAARTEKTPLAVTTSTTFTDSLQPLRKNSTTSTPSKNGVKTPNAPLENRN